MDRTDELKMAMILSAKRDKVTDDKAMSDNEVKEEIKGFFEASKDFMMKNRYTIGNNTYYPTSKACLRGFKKNS